VLVLIFASCNLKTDISDGHVIADDLLTPGVDDCGKCDLKTDISDGHVTADDLLTPGVDDCENAEAEVYPFFGTWRLEKIAFHINHVSSFEIKYRYSIPVNIEDFIGYELEYSSDFVRLGNRKIYEPEYWLSNTAEGWLLFSNENVFTPGYYTSPNEFLDSFKDKGITIGHIWEGETYPSFVNVYIRYPNPHMFRGELFDFDPDKLDYEFNPLFQGAIILNDDYMLIGSETLVLAKRISE
jgi:hypothetical protein